MKYSLEYLQMYDRYSCTIYISKELRDIQNSVCNMPWNKQSFPQLRMLKYDYFTSLITYNNRIKEGT